MITVVISGYATKPSMSAGSRQLSSSGEIVGAIVGIGMSRCEDYERILADYR